LPQPLHHQHVCGEFAPQHIARLPFSQYNQPTVVILTDSGITLLITNACLLVNDFWAFIKTDPVLYYDASPLLPACITFAAWFWLQNYDEYHEHGVGLGELGLWWQALCIIRA
jgi:hypothetical protein